MRTACLMASATILLLGCTPDATVREVGSSNPDSAEPALRTSAESAQIGSMARAAHASAATVGSGVVATRTELRSSFEIPGKSLTHVPAVRFTPDGKSLFVGTADGEVIQFEAGTRKRILRERLSKTPIHSIAMDRHGRRLVWLSKEGVLEARAIEAGQMRVLGRQEGVKASAMTLTPDGSLLALARGESIEVRRLPDLKVLRQEKRHQKAIRQLAWSPDGQTLATVSDDGALVLSDRALAPVRRVPTAQALYAVAWSPSGDRLAYGGATRQVYLLDVASGIQKTAITGQPYFITTLGFGPHGQHLAIGDESCDVWIHDLTRNKRLFHGKHHVECWLTEVTWTPDGDTFLFGCRPNTHSGRPTVFAGNVYIEAYDDPTHQGILQEERVLLASLDELIHLNGLGEEAKQLAKLLRQEQQADSSWKLTGSSGIVVIDGGNNGILIEGNSDFIFTGDVIEDPYVNGSGVPFVNGDVAVNTYVIPSTENDTVIVDGNLSIQGASPQKANAERKQAIDRLAKKLATNPHCKAVLAKLLKTRARRSKVYDDNCAHLNDNFQVNVWRLQANTK